MPSFPRRAGVVLRAALLTTVACLAIAPAATAKKASSKAVSATIAAGVTFNGVDLSGMTREQATAALTAALQGKRPSDADVVIRVAGRRHRLTMERIDYGFDVTKLVIRASKAPAGGAVAPAITWNEDKYDDWLTSLSAMRKKARDAQVKLGIAKQRIRGGRNGWKLSRSKLEKLVDPLLRDPTKARDNVAFAVTRVRGKSITTLRKQYGTMVTVDRPSFRLRLFKRLKLVKTYKIAVGSDGHSTPAGMYSVTSRQVNPAWHVPNSAWAGSLQGQVIPGGAPNNPLKARWIGLRDGIGIHGTSEAWSIGTRASHGCLRMHPSDVIDLYPRVPMGTPVRVR